MDFWFPDSF